MVEIEKVSYAGWDNCYQVSNDAVRLVATADVGPRLIHFGFLNGENELFENPDELGLRGGDEFHLFGGHRLWHAPEDLRRTYFPDNHPVAVERLSDGLLLTPPPETTVGMQKSIEVHLHPELPYVRLVERITNIGLWPVPTAIWSLTIMASGGTAVFPHPPRVHFPENLLSSHNLILWGYTDLSDPRWIFGRQHLLLRQDPQLSDPQKMGFENAEGWIAYARKGNAFIKLFERLPGVPYPDRGANVETWANDTMFEMETLGPMQLVEPGQTIEHVEGWYLASGVPALDGDEAVTRGLLPQVEEARRLHASA